MYKYQYKQIVYEMYKFMQNCKYNECIKTVITIFNNLIFLWKKEYNLNKHKKKTR